MRIQDGTLGTKRFQSKQHRQLAVGNHRSGVCATQLWRTVMTINEHSQIEIDRHCSCGALGALAYPTDMKWFIQQLLAGMRSELLLDGFDCLRTCKIIVSAGVD